MFFTNYSTKIRKTVAIRMAIIATVVIAIAIGLTFVPTFTITVSGIGLAIAAIIVGFGYLVGVTVWAEYDRRKGQRQLAEYRANRSEWDMW